MPPLGPRLQAASALAQFMTPYGVPKAVKNCNLSHLHYKGGRYAVPDADLVRFHEVYGQYLSAGLTPNYIETRQGLQYAPIVADIDIDQAQAERQYTRQHVMNFVEKLLDIVAECCELDCARYEVYILEKPRPAKRCLQQEDSLFKDGFHIMLPQIVTSWKLQHEIRQRLLPFMPVIFDGLQPLNASNGHWDDVLDHRVISSNGLTLYGSAKPEYDKGVKQDAQVYDLTMVIAACLQLTPGSAVPTVQQIEVTRTLPYLSSKMAYQRGDLWKEYNLSQRMCAMLVPPIAARHDLQFQISTPASSRTQRTRSRTPQEGAGKATAATESVNDDCDFSEPHPSIEQLSKFMDMLSAERSSTYESWYQVGMALVDCWTVDTGAQLLEEWEKFSKRTTRGNYTEQECLAKWDQLLGARGWEQEKLHWYSILFWAREDSPDEYRQVIGAFSVHKFVDDMMDLKKALKGRIKPENIQEYPEEKDATERWCRPFPFDADKKRMIYCRSAMGTGKTKQFVDYIILVEASIEVVESTEKLQQIMFRPARVLIISTRRNWARDVAARLRRSGIYVEVYLDLPVGANFGCVDKLMLSVEQLNRLSHRQSYDVLVLDEAECIRTQFFSTTRKDVDGCWHTFQCMMKNSQNVLVLDACLTSYTVDIFSRMVQDTGHELFLAINNCQPLSRHFLHLDCGSATAGKEELFRRMVADLKAGKKVVFVSASASVLMEFREVLEGKQEVPGIIEQDIAELGLTPDDYRFYTAIASDKLVTHDIENIKEVWRALRLVAFSPLFMIGVDYSDEDVFDSCFVYGTCTTLTGNMLLQLAFRVRHVRNPVVTMAINSHSSGNNLPLYMSQVYKHQQEICSVYLAKYRTLLSNVAGVPESELKEMDAVLDSDAIPKEKLAALLEWRELQKRYRMMHARAAPAVFLRNLLFIEMVKNRWSTFYARMFHKLVIAQGHTYSKVEVDVPKAKRISNKIDWELYDTVPNANAGRADILLMLQNQSRLDAIQKMELSKYMIDAQVDSLPYDDFAVAKQPRSRAGLFYLCYFRSDARQIMKHVLYEQSELADVYSEQIKRLPFPIMQNVDVPRLTCIQDLCQELGLRHSLDSRARIPRARLLSRADQLHELCTNAEKFFNVRSSPGRREQGGEADCGVMDGETRADDESESGQQLEVGSAAADDGVAAVEVDSQLGIGSSLDEESAKSEIHLGSSADDESTKSEPDQAQPSTSSKAKRPRKPRPEQNLQNRISAIFRAWNGANLRVCPSKKSSKDKKAADSYMVAAAPETCAACLIGATVTERKDKEQRLKEKEQKLKEKEQKKEQKQKEREQKQKEREQKQKEKEQKQQLRKKKRLV